MNPDPLLPHPITPSARRRDRHGRGLRSPLLPHTVPAWRNRREQFDRLVVGHVGRMQALCPAVETIEFAVEEVPPSDPAPWEEGVVLGRAFDAEPRAGLAPRVVVYRRVIASRCSSLNDLSSMIRTVLAQQVASLIGVSADDLQEDH